MIYNAFMQSFKENLRNELDFQGLTVKELSAKTGIIKGTLDNYLGVRASIPPADVAVKIAKALNVSVEYLVTGKQVVKKGSIEKNSENSFLTDFYKLPKNIQTSIKDLIQATNSSMEH